MKRIFVLFTLLTAIATQAQTKKVQPTAKKTPTSATAKPTTQKSTPVSKEKLVEITTDYGVMVARLYDATPLHRDNFLAKIKEGFYDSLLFHRVIGGFMIQGGDPTSKNAPAGAQLGSGSAPGDRIPAEFRRQIIHKRGALAAARDGNPERASSNCQFYIVQGQRTPEQQIASFENNIKGTDSTFKYTNAQKEIYNRMGGTPSLDQNYTVFGEVISGLNVIDKIAATQTQPGDRPVKDVHMKMRLLN
jgi:cyclophilin family peptidyl-prolyl cis-trans isomerase